MPRPVDAYRAVELPGPWTHRYVAANGARFHVVESDSTPHDGRDDGRDDAPLVLFLHGFPAFWWAWRAQLPAVAATGFRAVAMDLRGYGGSDKTPDGYDPFTLAQDVVGVVKALGERSAVLVGQGWGGYVAWTAAVLHPREVSALAVVSATHPSQMLRAFPRRARADVLRHMLAMQVPMRPERRLADRTSGFLEDHLQRWSAPGSSFPDTGVVTTYQDAIGMWPASHCALEYHRWLVRSRLRGDGRRFARRMAEPVRQPVLAVLGAADPVVPIGALKEIRRHTTGPVEERVLPGLGHFPAEEDPDAFNAALLPWLAGL